MRARQRNVPRDVAPARAAQQHDVRRPCRRLEREAEQLLVVGDLDAEPAPPALGQIAQGVERRTAVARELQIQHAERAGAAGRDGKPCVRPAARREHREIQRAEGALRINDSVFRE